ncbi:MAG: hypothetical protein ACRCX2_04305 [Paraclostridium sp.]
MNLGIDIGNMLIKTSKGIVFEGRISEDKPFMTDCDVIEFEGKTYYIEQGIYEHKPLKYKKKNYLPLLGAAIIKSTDANSINLVTGLPITQYKTEYDNLMKFLDEHKVMKFKFNGKERMIVLNKFDVYPEGVAIFNTLPKDILKQLEGVDVLIIDVGSKTTDCVIFKWNSDGTRTLLDPKSLPIGTHNVYNRVRTEINEKFGTRKTLEEVIDLFKTRSLVINGEKQDLSFLNDVISKELDKIVNDLELEYDIASIQPLLCGGGSSMMHSMFVSLYPSTVVSSDIFGNSDGYEIVCNSLFEEV